MSIMFSSCQSVKKLAVDQFDTFQVIGMAWMFQNYANLTKLDLNNFVISSIAAPFYVQDMLQGLAKLNIIVLSNKINIKNTSLNTPEMWLNVGTGTIEHPQKSKQLPSHVLVAKYDRIKDAYTYMIISLL